MKDVQGTQIVGARLQRDHLNMGHLYTEGGKMRTAKGTYDPRMSFVTTKIIIDKTRLENYSAPPKHFWHLWPELGENQGYYWLLFKGKNRLLFLRSQS